MKIVKKDKLNMHLLVKEDYQHGLLECVTCKQKFVLTGLDQGLLEKEAFLRGTNPLMLLRELITCCDNPAYFWIVGPVVLLTVILDEGGGE